MRRRTLSGAAPDVNGPSTYREGVERTRHARLAAALVVAAVAAGACSGSKHPAGAPTSTAGAGGCDRPHAAGLSAQSFVFDGARRTYQLYVPARYDGHHAVPVVFEFHGYSSDAFQQVVYGDFRPLADRDGFLIVAPDGQGDPRHFNLTAEPGLQDDVAMVMALLDHVTATFCVDTRRFYATGMSDGGAMTSVLACQHPDRFGAFGAVAVVLYLPGCGGSRPVAIAAFSGTADPIVPFEGGRVRCCGGATLGAAPAAMAGWAGHDGCAATPTDTTLGTEVVRRTWTGCRGGAVTFYIIEGGGHTWPGAAIPVPFLGLTTHQVDASSTIWAFFAAHPLAQ